MKELANDIARCNGAWIKYEDNFVLRNGCENCLRRTAPRPEVVVMFMAPPVIDFDCDYLIEP